MNRSPTPPSIVVGIDGSRGAIQAALWAVDEALSRDIPLRLLYAIEPDAAEQMLPDDNAAHKLAIAENAVRYAFTEVEALDKPVKIEVEITQERPITSLIRASTSAAMVCIGAVGLHHFRPMRVGSTVAALAISAHCPVAVIRSRGDRDERHMPWIIVDTHASSDNGVVLATAIEEARLRNLPLRAITCRQSGFTDEGVAEDCDRRIRTNLDRQLELWTRRYPELRVESVAVRGSLVAYLAEKDRSVELLVVGARGHEHLEQLVGPAGNAVLHKSECALLVVDHRHL
jgi:nucleotide-binding universal stress UspA family protein